MELSDFEYSFVQAGDDSALPAGGILGSPATSLGHALYEPSARATEGAC